MNIRLTLLLPVALLHIWGCGNEELSPQLQLPQESFILRNALTEKEAKLRYL